MEFVYATGGREKYFKATNVGDCVTRAITNATGVDYKEIYDRLAYLTKTRRPSKREKKYAHESPRNGVFTRVAKKYIEQELGWVWVPCMGIGTGCQVHLTSEELPSTGNIILNLSHHFSCVKNGVLYDTYDCSRGGNRCVYGYWRAPSTQELQERKEQASVVKATKEKQEQALNETKVKIEAIQKAHQSKLSRLEKKIKELQHELKIETNRMNREITKVKEQGAKALMEDLLSD